MDPLIPAIVSTLLQTILSAPSGEPQQPPNYLARPIPEESVVAQMQPPTNGRVELNGQSFSLSPASQIRDQNNRIVMPATVQQAAKVRYLTDAGGSVQRIWILTPDEAARGPR